MKVAQIKMVVKPGKLPEDVKSYGPISLLRIPSKVLELLLLKSWRQKLKKRDLSQAIKLDFEKDMSQFGKFTEL